jgi:hypothetical protein
MLLPRLLFTHHWTKTVTAFTSRLESAENYFKLNWTANIPRVVLYSLSADCTENISCGCYCRETTNCRRDVFTSALCSNKRGVATLSSCVHYPAMSNKHSYLYCCVRVSSRMGQTHHNIVFRWQLIHSLHSARYFRHVSILLLIVFEAVFLNCCDPSGGTWWSPGLCDRSPK